MNQEYRRKFERNLRECRPSLLAQLQEKGELESYLNTKAEQASETVRYLYQEQGIPFHEAEELMMSEYLLPDQLEQPVLGEQEPL